MCVVSIFSVLSPPPDSSSLRHALLISPLHWFYLSFTKAEHLLGGVGIKAENEIKKHHESKKVVHVHLILQWFCDCGHLGRNVSKLVIDMDVSHLRFYAMPDFLIHLPQIGNCIPVVVCIHFIPVSLFNGLCCCFVLVFICLFDIS